MSPYITGTQSELLYETFVKNVRVVSAHLPHPEWEQFMIATEPVIVHWNEFSLNEMFEMVDELARLYQRLDLPLPTSEDT